MRNHYYAPGHITVATNHPPTEQKTMSKVTFPVDTGIFKNRTTLKDSYTPDTLVGRDEELEEYRNALLPVVNNEEPDNTFLYGKTGSGKTACTDYIGDLLKDACERSGVNLQFLQINCKGPNTSYQVITRLINTMREANNQISTSGYDEETLYQTFFNEIEERGGTTLLVLDEIDSIDTEALNKLFYRVSRARSNYLDEAKVGTICISGELTLRDRLDTDVRSTLCEKSIEFEPYTAPELQDILHQRTDVAFCEGALDVGVIERAAALAAQDGGDARKALDLLREAGDFARQEERDEVKIQDVERAEQEVRSDRIMQHIRNLSRHERYCIYALTTLHAEGEERPRSQEVYQRYKKMVPQDEEYSARTVRDYLQEFAELDITERKCNTGGSQGNYNTHQLRFDEEPILRALEETIAECGVHRSVGHHDFLRKKKDL